MNSVFPVISALRIRFAFVLLSVVLAMPWQSAMAASLSTQFYLVGYINSGAQKSFNLADLQAFAGANPSAQKTVSVANSAEIGRASCRERV